MTSVLLGLLVTLVALACAMQILLCTIALPMLSWRPRRPSTLDRWLGLMLHAVAYSCALVRLPFTIGPFIGERVVFLCSPAEARHLWHHPVLQVLRLAGEGINLLLVALALQAGLSLS